MRVLLTLILISTYTITICRVLKVKFGKALPITLLSAPLFLFLSQMITGTFLPGFVVIAFVSLAGIPILIFKKDYKDYFSVGFICFLSIYIFVFCLDLGRTFSQWDELSHWGVMVKEMIRLDKWYFVDESRLLVHKDYPPFLSLIEMIWCKIAGGFYEVSCYRAIHTFMLSLIAPVIAEEMFSSVKPAEHTTGTSVKNALQTFIICFLSTIALFCFIRAFDGFNVINTIMTDISISVMFGYALLLVFLNSKKHETCNVLGLVLCEIGILLTKQIGITFVMLIWLYYALVCLLPRLKIGRLVESISFMAQIFCPMLFHIMWKLKISRYDISAQFDVNKISMSKIVDALKDSYVTTYERQILNRFLHALFEKNITQFMINISFVSICLIVLVLLLLIRAWNKEFITTKDANGICFVFVFGAICYSLTIVVLYMFCFSEQETRALDNYERYMGSYVFAFAVFVMAVLLLCGSHARNFKTVLHVGIAMLVVVVFAGTSMSALLPGALDGQYYKSYKNAAAKLDRLVPEDQTVFILSKDAVMAQYYINFYCDTTRTVLCYQNLLDVDSSDEYMGLVMNKAFGYDYLYVDTINKEFNEKFNYINENVDYIESKLYSIERDNGIKAVLVE